MKEREPSAAVQYQLAWERTLSVFLGWSPIRISNWVFQFEKHMRDEESLFYHEGPECYLSPTLVPSSLRVRLPERELLVLYRSIESAIRNKSSGWFANDSYDLVAAKRRVNDVLAQYDATLSDVQ